MIYIFIMVVVGVGIFMLQFVHFKDDKIDKNVDNERYNYIIKVQCYENYDPATNTSDWEPLPGSFNGYYSLEVNTTTQTTNFLYYGHKYKGMQVESGREVKATYNTEKFLEICDLILQDKVERYSMRSDDEGRIISSPEEYFFIITYGTLENGGFVYTQMPIKTPSKLKEIIEILDHMLSVNC